MLIKCLVRHRKERKMKNQVKTNVVVRIHEGHLTAEERKRVLEREIKRIVSNSQVAFKHTDNDCLLCKG